MTNRKKKLIELLTGSLKQLEQLPEEIEKENIYDENGYVDTDFMMAILQFISEKETILMKIAKALERMLGSEEKEERENSDEDGGQKWPAEKILQNCTLKDNVLYLPKVQFDKKSYLEAKKWIEEAGGSWSTSLQGFVFEFDATRVFSILHQGKRCKLQKEFQFFETPDHVADLAASKFSTVSQFMSILEPSAGRGSLIKALRRRFPFVSVDCFELMPENIPFLDKVPGANIIGQDFLTESCPCKYDRIIANPPFSKNQDIIHVKAMYEVLNPGGEISVITSEHWRFSEEKACIEFQSWLKEIGAEITSISAKEFHQSGTDIPTCLIWIRKPNN